MKRARLAVVFSAVLAFGCVLAPGCGSSVASETGLGEPIRFGYTLDNRPEVSQFFEGDIPFGGGPAVTGIDVGLNEVLEGQVKKTNIGVRVREPAFALAARLKGHGTGYWISRVNVAEVFAAGELRTELFFDLDASVKPGRYEIEFAGVDADKNFGPASAMTLVVKSRVPENAAAVFALRWDAAADLDLQVRAPDGTFLDPKAPSTAPRGTETETGVPGAGRRDHDSLAACVDDGIRQENVVFADVPAAGTYQLYANLFDTCRLGGTGYELSVIVAGTVTQRFFGRIAEAETLGGYHLGDHLADVTF